MDIIVGTAGHIDHGKTALVQALTGVNADRLPEEKTRGITIDLGFAELDLGDVRIGFIDVPGHEKFVKNMLAGASGIDLVALVVAADEGVMPQTREHFEICRLLETQNGIIILTKKDLVDEEFLELVRLDVAELVENSFLEDVPVVAVSAKTGDGIDELKKVLRETATQIPARRKEIISRLPIDRTFSVKGFGAVVTGTLTTGEISMASEMELLPIKQKVRVRGVQTHGKDVEKAGAGQRTAVNLGGINHDEIMRGMVLAESGILEPTQILDTEVEVLKSAKKSLRSRQRVRVHLGTIEALARIDILNQEKEIKQGEKDFVQLRLEIPVVAIPTERFILRQYSPQITIAGGKIIKAQTKKHRRKEMPEIRKFLEDCQSAEADNNKPGLIRLFLETAGEKGSDFAGLQAGTGWKKEILNKALAENIDKKSVIKTENAYVARTPFDNLKQKILRQTEAHHKKEPLSPGILRETLREKTSAHIPVEVFKTALDYLEAEKKIIATKDIVKAGSHNPELSAEEKSVRENIRRIYREADLQVPVIEKALSEAVKGTSISTKNARKVFQMLLNKQEIIKVTEDFYFTGKSIENLIEKLKTYASNEAENRLIGVPEFKTLAGISRKYAIPLLEYLDREHITRRAGDKRLVL
jgi:selenocysteine-specific elongation factor